MDPATAGLAGASIGALASLVGTTTVVALADRREHRRWIRDRRLEALSELLRALLRLRSFSLVEDYNRYEDVILDERQRQTELVLEADSASQSQLVQFSERSPW